MYILALFLYMTHAVTSLMSTAMTVLVCRIGLRVVMMMMVTRSREHKVVPCEIDPILLIGTAPVRRVLIIKRSVTSLRLPVISIPKNGVQHAQAVPLEWVLLWKVWHQFQECQRVLIQLLMTQKVLDVFGQTELLGQVWMELDRQLLHAIFPQALQYVMIAKVDAESLAQRIDKCHTISTVATIHIRSIFEVIFRVPLADVRCNDIESLLGLWTLEEDASLDVHCHSIVHFLWYDQPGCDCDNNDYMEHCSEQGLKCEFGNVFKL